MYHMVCFGCMLRVWGQFSIDMLFGYVSYGMFCLQAVQWFSIAPYVVWLCITWYVLVAGCLTIVLTWSICCLVMYHMVCLGCRLFEKQCEYEDSLDNLAKLLQEIDNLNDTIEELHIQVKNKNSDIHRWILNLISWKRAVLMKSYSLQQDWLCL